MIEGEARGREGWLEARLESREQGFGVRSPAALQEQGPESQPRSDRQEAALKLVGAGTAACKSCPLGWQCWVCVHR